MRVDNKPENKKQLRCREITSYEEIAMNAFPAICSELYDGWTLRYTGGYTFRGNSVNPIYPSSINLEEKILECESRYLEQELPSVFKMTEVVEEGLDLVLEKCGYEIQKEADIMTMQLDNAIVRGEYAEENNVSDEVMIDNHATEEWLDSFVTLNGTEDEPMKSIAKEVLCKIQNPIFCAGIYKNGEMVACGLGVFERGKLGLFDVRVLDQYRRFGLGTKICKQIINEGKKHGAKEAYLQVASMNEGAIKLYEKLGFTKAYTYWYRVKGGTEVV